MERWTSRRRWATLVLALFTWAALPALASAEPKKYFSMNAPASALPSTLQHLAVGLTNDPRSQTTLGSAHIGLPAGFTVTGATTSRGTASIVDGGVRLLNLALPPGQRVDLTIHARSSDCSGGGRWSVVAKQANDFNGLPGNDFALSAPAPSTSVTCADASTQSAEQNCVDNQPGSTCTVSIVNTAPLAGGTGTYTVQVTASAFPDPTLPDNGLLQASFQTNYAGFVCAGQARAVPVTARIVGPPNRTKTLKMRLSPSLTEGLTASQLDICAAAPATSLWQFEGDQGLFLSEDNQLLLKGRLADCGPTGKSSPLTPCISSRVRDDAGNWIVTAEIPAYPDDPYYR